MCNLWRHLRRVPAMAWWSTEPLYHRPQLRNINCPLWWNKSLMKVFPPPPRPHGAGGSWPGRWGATWSPPPSPRSCSAAAASCLSRYACIWWTGQNKYFSDSHQIFSRPLLTPPSSSPAPTAAVTPSRRRCRRWAVIGWDLNHLVMWHQYSPLIGPGAGGWPLLQPDADLGEDFISGDEEAGVCQLSGIQGDKTHNMKYFIKTKLLPGAQLDPPAAMQGPVRRLRQLCGLRPAQELRHVILAIMFWYLLISADIYRYLHIDNLIF